MTEEKSQTQKLTEAEAAEREAKNLAHAAEHAADAAKTDAYGDINTKAKAMQDAADADRPVPPTEEEVQAAKDAAEAAKPEEPA